MYLLDTNIFAYSVTDSHGVNEIIRQTSNTQIYLSTITVVEILYDGRLASLKKLETGKAKPGETIGSIMQNLKDTLDDLSAFNILPYPDTAEAIFKSIYNKKVNGPDPNDWRIASHAIVAGMTVVTDNTVDFDRIKEHAPGLHFVNWAYHNP